MTSNLEVFRAKEELERRLRGRVWAVGIGLAEEPYLVVYARPLQLRFVPDEFMGFKVVKRVMVLPPEFPRLLRKPKVMSASVVKYVLGVSERTGLSANEVLKSRPVKEYEKRVGKRVLVEY